MKQKPVLSIYGYSDYRQYLKDYYDFRKNSEKGYSYRYFSKDAGFSSPNILKLVIDGKRNIGASSVQKFCKGLGLNSAMCKYFHVLVQMNHEKDLTQKAELLRDLTKLTPMAQRRLLDEASVQYLAGWLCPVLREMVQLDEFRDDPYWIARRLTGRTSVEEISKAVDFLKKHEFLVKDENGKYSVQENMVISSDEIRSLAVRQYHKLILRQGEEILEDLDLNEREFGALTFILPETSMSELKDKLKKFRQELHLWAMQIAEDGPKENVVQVNFQMYRQSRKVD